MTNGHPATTKVSELRTSIAPAALTRELLLTACTVPPWGHIKTLARFRKAAISHHFESAVVDVHFGAVEFDFAAIALKSDSVGAENHRIVVRVGDRDSAGVVIEQNLVARLGDYCFDRGRRVSRLLAVAPVASDPHRVGDIAALEFNPDPGADFRQKRHADVRTRIRNAWHAPSCRLIGEHAGHSGLDSERRR